MIRLARIACLAALLLPCLAASAATEKRVWRVDSVIATETGDMVRIDVKGAVQGGGWHHARLKAGRGDAHSLVLEFLAQPPAAGATVISGLLPVSASMTLRAGRGMVAVRVMGEANDVTAQILH
jgi:hypothetical protein